MLSLSRRRTPLLMFYFSSGHLIGCNLLIVSKLCKSICYSIHSNVFKSSFILVNLLVVDLDLMAPIVVDNMRCSWICMIACLWRCSGLGVEYPSYKVSESFACLKCKAFPVCFCWACNYRCFLFHFVFLVGCLWSFIFQWSGSNRIFTTEFQPTGFNWLSSSRPSF